MKLKNITNVCLLMLLFCAKGFSQTNPRMVNENYMYTVFVDLFNGTSLDRTNNMWQVENNFKRELGLLKDTTATLRVQNGNLELTMINCPNCSAGSYQGNYAGSEITSYTTFLYGSFECRVKYAKEYGSWPAFWLIGGDGIPCESGGGFGNEIDIAEFWSETKRGLDSGCEPSMKLENNCHRYFHPDVCGISKFKHFWTASMSSSMDDNFHVYKCIWTPDKIDFYMDNILKNTLLKSSCASGYFPYVPLQLKLSQQVTDLVCSTIDCPQTSSFDYVRAKQFFLSPEITCPQFICSPTPASMDIDTKASDITWQLTPSYLFSGQTSGTGKSVNINPSSVQGKGKLTYTFKMPSGETFTAAKDIWIKGPDASETSFDVYKSNGVRATQVGNIFLMCPNTTYQIYVMNSGPVPLSNYTWTVPSAWTRNYTSQNIISVYTNSSPGGQVVVNATNTACNTIVPVITGYMGSNTSCGSYYMALTPNPSASETSIVISADGEKVVNENTQWDLEAYDQQLGQKEKKTKIKGKDAKINTSSWKDGVYIINAIVDGQKISEKLLVKH